MDEEEEDEEEPSCAKKEETAEKILGNDVERASSSWSLLRLHFLSLPPRRSWLFSVPASRTLLFSPICPFLFLLRLLLFRLRLLLRGSPALSRGS